VTPGDAFAFPVRVYWEDTDAGGVVYHASYVRFLERARTEYFRALGIEQDALRRDNDVLFVVAELRLRFLRPARLDDYLEVGVRLHERRAASLAFHQTIQRVGDGELLVDAQVRAACVSATALRPRAIPDGLLAETSTS